MNEHMLNLGWRCWLLVQKVAEKGGRNCDCCRELESQGRKNAGVQFKRGVTDDKGEGVK